ncbi:GFA family protein [Aspergillus clavatus NRRL 1]|uniref:DUF636 domain protein n=1 Tax=Aspergillus clavatus (strain ATCC 1007 / CBS 513.65 / DSM 816 / NCTC 3887 / NRRL 1 / QM 1276 / 107) TaxID=344612 RepID=A1C8S5_ASPCL|nr:DUF636 domain protein [Aspergillus clavatus NRRL 1]EAW13712.1 DUF636 domain protein [Aspergillus clavatus NRRL 1]
MPTGSCTCQAIKYEYTGEPMKKAVCHCLTCRKYSSGSTVNLLVPKDHFSITSGTPKEWHIVHQTGMHMTTRFCGDCGCLLYKTADRAEFQDGVVVLAGTLDDPRGLDAAKPDAEFFIGDRAAWLPVIGDAEQCQGFE